MSVTNEQIYRLLRNSGHVTTGRASELADELMVLLSVSSAAESNERQIDAAGKAEPVAWRVEQRAGRYTFVEHVENLKLYAGANIVPLFRAFHSVDGDLNTVMDRLESMVTWEPRSLTDAAAIDRMEHINRLLYELLNPHPNAAPLTTQPTEGGERKYTSALTAKESMHTAVAHALRGSPIEECDCHGCEKLRELNDHE